MDMLLFGVLSEAVWQIQNKTSVDMTTYAAIFRSVMSTTKVDFPNNTFEDHLGTVNDNRAILLKAQARPETGTDHTVWVQQSVGDIACRAVANQSLKDSEYTLVSINGKPVGKTPADACTNTFSNDMEFELKGTY